MKYFYLFAYYRLYQLSERWEPRAPLLGLLTLVALTSILHVYTLFSIITICFGFDPGHVFRAMTSRFEILAFMVAWAGLIWVIIKVIKIHDRAFSCKMVENYKASGCKDWWLFAYFLASIAAMAWTTWVAGARLGLHH